MKTLHKTISSILVIAGLLSFYSCEKYLNEKPNKQLTLPADQLENLQLLLDNTSVLNLNNPSAGEIASDNIYIVQSQWDFLSSGDRTSSNTYIWEQDVFNDNDNNDWALSYATVFNANIVLDAAAKFSDKNTPAMKNVIGSALFFRAHTFYQLLQEFSKAYDGTTASSDQGIVLKLNSDINEKLGRASVKECYEQVFSDLQTAAAILPVTPLYKTRPSKPAAWAVLARAYLQTGNYNKAMLYADSCISVYPGLIDYNTLNATAAYPVARFNPEVIWHGNMILLQSLAYPFGRVNEELFNSYAANDLRRSIFYKVYGPNDIAFKGSYNGSLSLFSGVSSNEMYLISAECYARLGETSKAMISLNILLEKRWKKGSFVPVTAANSDDALLRILEERRKELPFRNIRWSDLKRLNKDPRFRKTIVRNLNNRTYTLDPNQGYVFPLPQKATLTGGY